MSAGPSRPARCPPCCPAAAASPTRPPAPRSAALWGAEVPAAPGRDVTGILTAARDGQLGGLLVGGVDPADLPDPALAEAALAGAGFVVSLEMFPTAVTEWADVVLPGRRGAGEGRQLPRLGGPRPHVRRDAARHRAAARRPGAAGPGRRDGRRPAAAHPRVRPRRAGRAGHRPPAGRGRGPRRPRRPPRPTSGLARPCSPPGVSCSTSAPSSGTSPSWPVPPARPWSRIGAGTAARLGLVDGDRLTVSGATGAVTLPVRITAMPDQVVWLPMRSPGSEIRTDLGTGPGGVVRLSAGSAL